MIVFIKYATGIRRVVDVTLLRGFILKCRHVTEDRADPALWYKALVLDSILVDCDGQNVFWSTEGPPGNIDIHLCHESDLSVETAWSFFNDKESIFNEDECYDFDPAHNELFETALDVFNRLSWISVDKDGNSEAYDDVLKMLHVFILPRVKFTTNDRTSVKNILKEIEEHRVNFEEHIQEKDDILKVVEHELHEKRVLLLEDGKFSRSDFVSTCDPDFLNVFLLHLEKFILKCNEELDLFDRKITPIRHSQIREHLDHLKALRYDRDTLYKTVEKAVIAREEIRNVVVRKESRGVSKGENSASHQMDAYLNVSKRIDRIKDDIQDLIRTKIKISSVREAVSLTLNEIDRDTYSYGYNSRNGSFQDDEDMLHVTSKPKQWYTLTEKVALCLHLNENGIWSEHMKFCEQIELQCQRLCDESELFSFPTITKSPLKVVPSTLHDTTLTTSPPAVITDTPGTPVKTDTSGSPVIDKQCSPTAATNGSLTQNSRCSIEIVPKEKCRLICEEFVAHTADMAVLIAKELCPEVTDLSHNFVNKVYVCYEEYVSKKLMAVLNSLYQRSYLDTCPGLSAWLCNVRTSSGYLEETKLADIIQPPGLSGTSPDFVSSEELSKESSSNETKTEEAEVRTHAERARNVGPRNVHEVYEMYNEMADTMPDRFTAIFEHDTELPTGECFTSGTVGDEGSLPAPCSNKPCVGTNDLHKATSNSNTATHSETPLDTNDDEYITPTAWTISHEPCKQSSQPQSDANRSTDHASSHKHRDFDPPLSKTFNEEFQDFSSLVEEAENADTLFRKIHKTTGMLQYANTTLARLRKTHGVSAAVSADDLVNVFTSLLCTLDSKRALKLYASVNMMDHLKPKFLKGDVHDYALVTLSVAFQNLFFSHN